ncbi:beta-N-acetylhexosaminidase [Paenibacillus sp. MY03]|uniref:beta-N-acetylhexosaminidase n=1 Tax=Paenibacillus sp. MY03 TaxID=302980 RepID=UPI0015C6450C|nr:beta-N-acetylhexosaminidase [Paenibacillus sp. MY03]
MSISLHLVCDANVLNPIGEIGKQLNFSLSEEGVPVTIEQGDNGLTVAFENGKGSIIYTKKVELFRGLSLLIPAIRRGEVYHVSQSSFFDNNGAMFDCSRNAVITVQAAKKMIRYMALMGLDTFMLYTEDTYEVEGLDYFGYMRGAYTKDELMEIDRYGAAFGVEVIPCIQTLAHLTQALKWKEIHHLGDTKDGLMVGEEETYQFIEKLIAHCANTFATKRIHLGMDEALQLGLGQYLKKYGYKSHRELMNIHLERVMAIVKKYGLRPMIWSDMLTYNERTEEHKVAYEVDRSLDFVYWEYFTIDVDAHLASIAENQRLSDNVMYAGAIWGWSNVAVNYIKTFDSSETALIACKKAGVKQVFVTVWGNTGTEVNLFYNLLGLQYYAEHGYNAEVTTDLMRQRFLECTDYDYDAFYEISRFNVLDDSNRATRDGFSNVARCILYQDLLKGLFDVNLKELGMDLTQHYTALEQMMSVYRNDELFDYLTKLATVLKQKWDLGIRITNAYRNKDFDTLKGVIAHDFPTLAEAVKALHVVHRNQWLATYKPFGWEVLDARYAALLSAIDYAAFRLNAYLSGEVETLPELDYEKLFFNDWATKENRSVIMCHHYGRVVSAGIFDL